MSACVLLTLGYEESCLNSHSQLYCVHSKLCEVPFSYMSLPVYVVWNFNNYRWYWAFFKILAQSEADIQAWLHTIFLRIMTFSISVKQFSWAHSGHIWTCSIFIPYCVFVTIILLCGKKSDLDKPATWRRHKQGIPSALFAETSAVLFHITVSSMALYKYWECLF